MPHRAILALLPILLLSSQAFAQTPPEDAPADEPVQPAPLDATGLFGVGSSEWMVTAGNIWGVQLFHSAPGHHFVMQTISWGRVLTKPLLSGRLRGQFEWAFEFTPVYRQYAPQSVYGFGWSPIVWRWNFEPRGRYAWFAELSGGELWSNRPVPESTTTSNYTAHVGGGVRVLVLPQQAIVFAYRFDHISNGNRLENNPGVNAHGFHIGWSYVRPRRTQPVP